MKEENVVTKVFKSFMSMVVTVFLLASLTVIASAQTPPGYKHEEKVIKYDCDATATILSIPITVPINMSAKIEAYVPEEVLPEVDFTVENAFVTIQIPEDDVETLKSYLGWTSFKGEASLFEVHADNPNQTVNVANPVIPIPATPVPPTGDLEFRVPASGGLSVTFIAGSSGDINLSAGNISAKFEKVSPLLDPGWPVTLQVDCEPKAIVDEAPQDLTLVTIPIAEN